jgi:hypothetical protein
MPKKTSPAGRAHAGSLSSAESLPAPQSKTSSRVLKRPLPAASVAKAKKAFKSFSLSKFAGSGMPSNYVAAGQSPTDVQRQMIAQHIENLNDVDSPARGITIALPDDVIKKLLPSFNVKARTIDLDDVIGLIQQNMKGTEFYANGNPTLNRLAIQTEAQQIVDNIKKGVQK